MDPIQIDLSRNPKQAEFVTDTHRYTCYSGGFGSGKCTDENSNVFSKRGRIAIKHIRRGDMVYSFDGDKYVLSRVNKLIDSGKLKSYSVILQGGYSIRVSATHPFLKAYFSNNHKNPKKIVDSQWVEVNSLKKGDFIAVPENLENLQGNDLVPHAELIGYLLGDGMIRKKNGVLISMGQNEVVERVKTLIPEKCFLKYLSKYDYAIRSNLRDGGGHNFNPLLRYLNTLGLVGSNSYTKFIPSVFFNADRQSIIDVLSGLFVTDGWIDKKGVHIQLMSERLIDDIRFLLLKLGIVSQKCRKNTKYKGTIRFSFDLSITHLADLKKCIVFNLLYKKQKLIDIVSIKEKSLYKQRGQDKQWRHKNNLFCRIKEIAEGDEIQMYDLEIEGTHNFIAENILIHNTYAGAIRSLVLSQFPGNVGLIGRLTYRELSDTTQKTFFEICPPEYYEKAKGGFWKPSDSHLRLINGSEILFRHLDTISEKELLSLNLGWFFIDQAEEISERVWRTLLSRLRLNRVPRRFGFVVCNPDPSSWIYTTFKKPKDEGTLRPDYHLIESSTQDNPYNPPEYVQALIDAYPEELRKRFIEGRWDAVENQIYKEFDKNIHVVRPFTTPRSWEYIVGVDHGMVNPTAALLAAIDHDGNLFIIDEYYRPGIVSEHATAIKKMVGDLDISMWVIDPSTRNKTRERNGMPWSVIEEYEDQRLYFIPANNEMVAGINRVKEFLKLSKNRFHPVNRGNPAPRLYIFSRCINVIAELQNYKWKQTRGSSPRNDLEIPSDYNDHAVDALRYIVMTRYPSPTGKISPDDFAFTRSLSSENTMTQEDYIPDGNDMFGSMPDDGGGLISME